MLLVGWPSRRRLLPALGRGGRGAAPRSAAAGAAGVWGCGSPSALRAPLLPPGVVGRPPGSRLYTARRLPPACFLHFFISCRSSPERFGSIGDGS